jgi:DNA repair protein RecO (recombination protein O)
VSQEKSEGVVLRAVDFSETSRIVTLLTPERGKLACLAKGVRRKNSRLASALDTFNRVELVYYWKEARQVQTLAEAALLDGFPGIKCDLERVTYAAFALELVYRAVHENEPSQGLYADMVDGLTRLAAWPGDARTHVCWQVLRLLGAAGFGPELDRCVACGGDASGAPGFAFGAGVVCGYCRADRRVSAETLSALRALNESMEACPAIAAPAETFALLRHYARRQLECDFRSARVIEQMFG